MFFFAFTKGALGGAVLGTASDAHVGGGFFVEEGGRWSAVAAAAVARGVHGAMVGVGMRR